MNILQKFSIPRASGTADRARIICLLAALFAISFLLAISVGGSEASVIDAISSALRGDNAELSFRIIFFIRLPRAVGAALAGAALSVSGIIIQAVLNNPMAAPNVIGVNAGAGFAVILAMAVFPQLVGIIPLAAFVGALGAALVIYAVSAVTGAGRVTVILVGVAVGSVLTAGINTVKTLFPDSVYDVSGFLIGGLSSAVSGNVYPAALVLAPALILALLLCRALDALALGDSVASGLGVSVKRARLGWLTLAALLAGGAVSYAGLIGFVGLIVPHLMRRFAGNIHRVLIPASIFGGGALVLLADTVARTAFAPYELPVGIILSLLGGPFFIFLILRERSGER